MAAVAQMQQVSSLPNDSSDGSCRGSPSGAREVPMFHRELCSKLMVEQELSSSNSDASPSPSPTDQEAHSPSTTKASKKFFQVVGSLEIRNVSWREGGSLSTSPAFFRQSPDGTLQPMTSPPPPTSAIRVPTPTLDLPAYYQPLPLDPNAVYSVNDVWGSAPSRPLGDITDRELNSNGPSQSNNNNGALSASSSANPNAPNPPSTWASAIPNDSGDKSGKWDTAAQLAHNPNKMNGQASSSASQQQQGLTSGMDQENMPVSPVVPLERTPLDDMIYRKGWGVVEVKQDVPWPVAPTPPPVDEDPSHWKPKANTGTDVWEKHTGHRTQQWPQQTPEAPWSIGAGPTPAGDHLKSDSWPVAQNHTVILTSRDEYRSQGRNPPSWDMGSSSPRGGGSPNSSWSNNNNSADGDWSEWRDPTSGPKSADPNGTQAWSVGPSSSSSHQGGPGSSFGSMNDPRKSSDLNAYPPKQLQQRGWPADSQYSQRPPAPDWNNSNDMDWQNRDQDKWAQRQEPKPRTYSPPSNRKEIPSSIYESRQYQQLIEMGFIRNDIEIAMRNNNMAFEGTLVELQRNRRQGPAQSYQPSQQQSGNYGDMKRDGIRGGPSQTMSSPSNIPGIMPLPNNPNKPARAPDNIQAMARQLSIAAQQGIINPRLLSQPLAPQTTYLLHKLMQHHRSLQTLMGHHQMLGSQKMPSPAQQQNFRNLVLQITQLKSEISQMQKQIDAVQNEFMKSPNDARFQGGPTLVDLADSQDWIKQPTFTNPSVPLNQPAYNSQSAGGFGGQQQQAGWRMPTDPSSIYSTQAMSADSWGNNIPNAINYGGAAPGMNAGAMWDTSSGFGGGMPGVAMPYRPSGQQHHQQAMDDSWNMGGGQQMKMGMHPDPLSPSRGGNSNGGAYGMDEADGNNWGNMSRQMDPSLSTFASSRFTSFDALPEFEPGKPWRGSQLLSADEDPHLTPGSVAKSPLG